MAATDSPVALVERGERIDVTVHVDPDLGNLSADARKFKAPRSLRDIEPPVNLWVKSLDNIEVEAPDGTFSTPLIDYGGIRPFSPIPLQYFRGGEMVDAVIILQSTFPLPAVRGHPEPGVIGGRGVPARGIGLEREQGADLVGGHPPILAVITGPWAP